MPTFHVLTVSPYLPVEVFDQVLTEVERALEELGASRIWVDPHGPPITVMADLPSSPPDGSHPEGCSAR
jgi:hypothetical protein